MGTLTRRPPSEDTTSGVPRRSRRKGAGRGGRGRARRLGGRSLLGAHRALSIVAIAVTVVLVGASLYAYAAYRSLYDSIHREVVTGQMLGPRPPKLNGSLNVLMIGSDSRAGTRGRYGRGIDGSRSDTAMLLHISPTHNLATVISFPRDSMVPVYSCLSDGHGHSGQQAAPGEVERLNATFSYGGAPCLWKTLEQTTHIHIDHFVEVDFSGFKRIVNDVGGVSVCLPYPIHDRLSGLNLSRGRHVLNGREGLAFVRVRHIGDGSDLERIKRQQLFLASVAQKIKKNGVLANPARTYSLVHDVARSLTTDSAMSLSNLYAIAGSLRGLSTSSLRFISVPVVPYAGDPLAEVSWAPDSSQLFSAIAHDNHILRAAKNAKTKPSPVPTVPAAQVQLQVLNGSGTYGVAGTAATELTSRGFTVTGTGNAPTFGYTSNVIEYQSASQLPQVNTLKKAIAGAQVKRVPGLQPGTISLIVGTDFTGLPGHHNSPHQSVSNLAKNYGGITASTNICRDSAAFGVSP